MGDIDFAELRQFKQGEECDDDVMRVVFRTAVNLEKVNVDGDTTLIGELLENCKRLKYLEIDADEADSIRVEEDPGDVLTALEGALPRTLFAHTEPVKIRINLQ